MAKLAMIFAGVVCMMVLIAPHAEGLTCSTVVKNLNPCRDYLKNGGSVPDSCCSGARSLNMAANSGAARQEACRCMKSLAKAYKVNQHYASAVPGKCNVNIDYAIDYSTDCNSYK
ncbi:non-specific lipid-transfer protein [Phtheirospermum japonicum]|uniref:Non-specific lipid-transfer protein n=1 Tax=Phtheirospermum japonicum TaxID=374723 RepID=A0A830BP14_9LAMI|nr:non-specific lipid-transfer protein [Phtheirospermum japonicum]